MLPTLESLGSVEQAVKLNVYADGITEGQTIMYDNASSLKDPEKIKAMFQSPLKKSIFASGGIANNNILFASVITTALIIVGVIILTSHLHTVVKIIVLSLLLLSLFIYYLKDKKVDVMGYLKSKFNRAPTKEYAPKATTNT